jgi:PAS domain S-box-containing protein
MMNRYTGLPTRTKVFFILALIAFKSFLITQILILSGFLHASYEITIFSLVSFILYIPLSTIFIYDLYKHYRKEKQEIEEKMMAINCSNIVVIFDEKGFIREVNENFCLSTGYKTHELLGKHHSDLISPSDKTSKRYNGFWKKLQKGEYIEGNFERIKKNGENLWLSATYTPVQTNSGKVYEVIKIAQDITQSYQDKVELLQQNTYLEHAAKILRHDMHSGINTYIPRGLNSLKRRLTQKVIEELKLESPIRLLEDGLTHTQKVYKGVKEFTNLVKKNTVLEKETKDLKEILVSYLVLTAYADQVSIEWLPSIPVNEPLFCTAIDNFIRNGLKYNDSQTKFIKIKMKDEKTLAVIDNGRGMTKFQFENNAKPYVRGNNQGETGTGLGLNISIAILNEHGFSTSCEKQKQGTMITVRIK